MLSMGVRDVGFSSNYRCYNELTTPGDRFAISLMASSTSSTHGLEY
jgi:hypothetical protein